MQAVTEAVQSCYSVCYTTVSNSVGTVRHLCAEDLTVPICFGVIAPQICSTAILVVRMVTKSTFQPNKTTYL